MAHRYRCSECKTQFVPGKMNRIKAEMDGEEYMVTCPRCGSPDCSAGSSSDDEPILSKYLYHKHRLEEIENQKDMTESLLCDYGEDQQLKDHHDYLCEREKEHKALKNKYQEKLEDI